MRTFIQTLCAEAAAVTWRHFGSRDVLYTKAGGPTDVVTQADIESHEHCLRRIKAAYPGHAILSEEGRIDRPDADGLWVIDPLDGSRNFSTGTPLFGTMIAFVQSGEPRMAAICLPNVCETYFAEKGGGAFLNGLPIRCSAQAAWTDGYGCGNSNLGRAKNRKILERLAERAEREPFWTSNLGAIAVSAAWVAAGRRDWYLTMAANVWDTTAPGLLLQEAGCVVTDAEGAPWTYGAEGILAANAALHPRLVELCR